MKKAFGDPPRVSTDEQQGIAKGF